MDAYNSHLPAILASCHDVFPCGAPLPHKAPTSDPHVTPPSGEGHPLGVLAIVTVLEQPDA